MEPLLARPPGEVRLRGSPGLSLASTHPFLAATLQPRRLLRRSGSREALQCPLGRGLIEPVPGDLDHDQSAPSTEQAGYPVQGAPEVLDVVQGQARHHVVKGAGIGELLDPHALEKGSLRCPRIDRGHGVASARHGAGQLPLSAADLKHPGRRVADMAEDELLDAFVPPPGLTHAAPYPPNILLQQGKGILRERYRARSSRFGCTSENMYSRDCLKGARR